MGMQMSARRVDPPEPPKPFKITDVQPLSAIDRARRWTPMITVRVLSREEHIAQMKAYEEEEKLPYLGWSSCTRLALEMLSPYRPEQKPQAWNEHDFDNNDWLIEHDAFVKAHEALPYVEVEYLNHILLTRGEMSRLTRSNDVEAFGKRYFDLARDFIRECALNGYEASYG